MLQKFLLISAVAGIGITFAAGMISQIWQTSIAVEGTDRKKLTPAGWLFLGIISIGVLLSVAAEIARENLDEQAAAARQKQAITMQPLVSLSLHWRFPATDARLSRLVAAGVKDIDKNSRNEQGGVPIIPYDVEDYDASLLPFLDFVALSGKKRASQSASTDDSIMVLVPMDESKSAILSFGNVDGALPWSRNTPDAGGRGITGLSAGFRTTFGGNGVRPGASYPKVSNDAGDRKQTPYYSIDWNLDPRTLTNSLSTVNRNAAPIANLPKILKIAILYDISTVPFAGADFTDSAAANLWQSSSDPKDQEKLDQTLTDSTVMLTVNGYSDVEFTYVFKDAYRDPLMDDWDDDIGVQRLLLEYERHD